MPPWNSRIDTGVDSAIGAYARLQAEAGRKALPIDLMVLAQAVEDIEIEEREMIPEAAVEILGSRFRVYLRSNFRDRPGRRVRERFSLAHEIAHTFFFDLRDGEQKPMRRGPRGLDLESACHEAASRLLVPARYLSKELVEKHQIAGEDVLALARTFDVSLEVILRRLRNEPAIESQDLSFTLCRLGKIEYAMYPSWLGSILSKPAGKSVQSWFRLTKVSLQGWFRASGLQVERLPGGSYLGTNEELSLVARRLEAGPSSELFEIRRYNADTPRTKMRF